MDELYFAAAYRMEECLQAKKFFDIKSNSGKEEALNEVIGQVFEEMNFPEDKLDSLRKRLVNSMIRSKDLDIDKVSSLCKKALDIAPQKKKPKRFKPIRNLVRGSRRRKKLTDAENKASIIGKVLGKGSTPSAIRAYQSLSSDMNHSQKLAFAERIKSTVEDPSLDTILDLCQKLGFGLQGSETIDLFDTIKEFEGDQYFEEKVNLYKDLSQDLMHKPRAKLRAAIKKLPSDQYLATRANLCVQMKDKVSESDITKLVEEVEGFPSDDLLQKKSDICVNLSSKEPGGMNFRLLTALQNPFNQDEYEERKLDLFGKLDPHVNFANRNLLVKTIDGITNHSHAGIKMDLAEKICAPAKDDRIFDLLMLVDQFPDDDSLPEKFSICNDLCSDNDANENYHLILGVGIFPSDNVIRERAVLYKHLSAKMTSDQKSQLQLVLKDFKIQKGDDLKDLTYLFTEHLLDHYATNKEILKLFSSFLERPLPWIDEGDPQVSRALNYCADIDAYKDSELDLVEITVKRDEVLKDPVRALDRLISEWDPKAVDGEKLFLKVNFAKDGEELEGGIDAGGLSRQYLSLIFEGLYKKYDLANLSLEGGIEKKEKALESLGKLFISCYHSSKSQEYASQGPEERFVNTLLMGSQFRDEVFSAITSLTSDECDGSLDSVPFDKRLKITKLLCPPSEKDEPPVHMELLYKDIGDISHEDREKLIPYIQGTVIDEEDQQNVDRLDNAFTSFLDKKNESTWTALMDQVLKQCFIGRTEAVQTIAKGMKTLCAARGEGDVNEFWDERIRKENPSEMSGAIQGNLNRDLVARAVVCHADSPLLKRKAEYLQEWITDSSTEEDKLKRFLMILSGSPALPRNQEIAIQKLTRENAGLEFHTCAFQIDLCDNFEEISLLEGAPDNLDDLSDEEQKQWEKQAFIQLLEKEIEGPLNFTSA